MSQDLTAVDERGLWLSRNFRKCHLDGSGSHLERVSRGCALAVGLVGAMVLVGWFSGVAQLTTVLPGLVSMKPNTAVALVAIAAAVAMPDRGRLVLPVGVFAVAIGSVTLLEYLLGRSFGIDVLLPGINLGGDAPRMAPATAVSLVLLGSALIAAARGRTPPMRGFAVAALCVGQVALLGYAYGVSSLYSVAGATSMALHTALSVAVLSLCILLLDPSAWLVSLFRDRGSTGRLVRLMVPFVIIAPFLLGWLCVGAQDLGWFDAGFGVSALVMSMTFLGGIVTWRAILSLRVLDRQRDDAVQSLAETNRTLEDQQFYTRSLIESNVDALMTTDPQGTITDVNQQVMTLTGCARAELIGAPFRDFFTDPARADAGIAQVLAEHTVTDYELTARARDGKETFVSYNAATIHDRDHRLRGVFAAARDVTDRRRIERALQEKNVELEHASRMKSEFLATMSHELRTPRNSVIGFSEALKDGLIGELTGSQQEYIGDIFTSGQHLLSLINDILDLSKVEAGMMDLELEAADVSLLLTNALSVVREKALERSIRLDLELDEHLGVTALDVRKTKQIVYNLLSNAVKFSGEGGLVSLRAGLVPRRAVGTLDGTWPVRGFGLVDNEFTEFLQICVTDDGIGISQENMAKLFQAFTQIDSTLARRFEGTGLGLAMVKQMSELLGGTVAVTSKDGEGACFAAWVPLRTPAQPVFGESGQVQVQAQIAPDPQVDERVALVVEDEDNAAALIRILLEAEGFAVLRASSAEEALLMAPHQSLDLITLDIVLPGIDGWEFLATIRADATLGKVPVVVISGTSSAPPVALAGGAAAVLQKPVSRAALTEALANLGFDDAQDRNPTVLVVDDDPKAVELIAAFLPAPAYATVRAYGGQEAIVLAHRMRPDLILLDLMMPKVSGFDVVHALKSDPSTAGIPILVITAKHVTATDRAALNPDPDADSGHVIHIIEKAGFSQADFLDEVRRALPDAERKI